MVVLLLVVVWLLLVVVLLVVVLLEEEEDNRKASLLFLAHIDTSGLARIVLIGLSNVTLLICVSHIVVITSSLVLILNMANLVKQENTSIFFHWLHQHTAVFSLVSCVGQRRLVK